MRLHVGKPVHSGLRPPEGEGWQPIRSPSSRSGLLASGFVGLLLPGLLYVALGVLSTLASRGEPSEAAGRTPVPWTALVLPLLLYIPLHELLHAACYPDHGLSSKTTLIVWPGKVLFGVYYDGCMARRRWLVMRLAPLFFLSLVPTGLLALFQNVLAGARLDIALQVLLVVNSIGSGADVVAVILVLRQVPAAAVIGFYGGNAYWRPAPSNGG